MSYLKLLVESLSHYWRTNAAIALGALIASSVLTGAFLVGDSMRGTLRALTLERLGSIDHALVGSKLFRADLEKRWNETAEEGRSLGAGVLMLRGAVVARGARAHNVQIIGTTERFWTMFADIGLPPVEAATKVIVNDELAAQLNVAPGARIELRLEKASSIPREGLLGRREDTIEAVPLTIDATIPSRGVGRFTLELTQRTPLLLFVPLDKLAEAMEQPQRANALLVQGLEAGSADERLRSLVTLDDLGIEIVAGPRWISIETAERIVSNEIAGFVRKTAEQTGAPIQPVMTYLANTIATVGQEPPHEVPYSVVTATPTDLPSPFGPFPMERGSAELAPGKALINHWTADKLGADIGAKILLNFYRVNSEGSLDTDSKEFTVAGILKMEGLATDKGYTPVYPGITDADNFADWDAPFPVDLKRISKDDEKYWDDYRTGPKVFIRLEDGQEIWTSRYGKLTSLRIAAPAGVTPLAFKDDFARKLRANIDVANLGFSFIPVREQSLAASQGSTDFGMLFAAMSFFLITSAALLVGLMFRLNTERRASAIGTLLAMGWRTGQVRWLLVVEGVIVAAIGATLGLLAAVAYANGLVRLLSSWWYDAVGTSFIEFHATPASFIQGWLIAVFVAAAAIFLSTRRLKQARVPDLLNGNFATLRKGSNRARLWRWGALLGIAVGVLCIVAGSAGIIPSLAAFFGGGTALLLGGLSLFALALYRTQTRDPAALVKTTGSLAMARIGIRNSQRNPLRGLVTAALLALAVFLVVSVGGMRHGESDRSPNRDSGNGGFALVGQSSSPLTRDLGDADGRFALNVSSKASDVLAQSEVFSFRVQQGEDASCLNVYQPQRPTLLGAPETFIERGGFAFASTLAETEEEKANPWRLLNRTLPDGAIPAIGDAATLQWILKVPVGRTLEVPGEDGQPVKLRIVGALSESVFQGQLVISESQFLKHFPSVSGKRFFLLAPPLDTVQTLSGLLETDLEDFGFDVETSASVIKNYLAVQETYMGAFQTLGGLGLLLGTLGLGAVLLRNILERRSELALMRALGFQNAGLGLMVVAETTFLLVTGIFLGTLCALIAIAPQLARVPAWTVLLPLMATLAAVLAIGVLISIAAVAYALKSPVLESLRAERA